MIQAFLFYLCVMKNNIQIISFLGSESEELLAKAQKTRTEVFVYEQKVSVEIEIDEYEKVATHYLLKYKNAYIGAARYRETVSGIKLERFAILSQYRDKGMGKVLLEKILENLKGRPEKIYLNAQEKAISFYERGGFEITSDAFIEANIVHKTMHYKS
jgi:predicted GNAT family N-acyltransferase